MNLSGSDIKLRQLQIFREVVRAGSERLAAQILRVTQPAVSQNIRQLEVAAGFALFVRDNGRLRPTEEACDLRPETSSKFW